MPAPKILISGGVQTENTVRDDRGENGEIRQMWNTGKNIIRYMRNRGSVNMSVIRLIFRCFPAFIFTVIFQTIFFYCLFALHPLAAGQALRDLSSDGPHALAASAAISLLQTAALAHCSIFSLAYCLQSCLSPPPTARLLSTEILCLSQLPPVTSYHTCR